MLLYHFLRVIVWLAVRVFFRRMQVHNRALLNETKGPLIVVLNHPNTFMDAYLAASLVPRQVAFIANGSIFNRFTRPFFKALHVIPIYRKKDTADVPMSQAELNKFTFQRCYDYLQRRGTIVIFPEGTSELERRLREIKTGAARIALGAEHDNFFQLGVKILPVGLNYADPTRFRSDVFVNVGQPIAVADFKEAYNPESYESVEALTKLIEDRLSEMVIITEDEDEDSVVRQVEVLYKNQLFEEFQLSSKEQKDEFDLLKQIVKAVRYAEEHRSEAFKTIRVRMTNYLENLQKLGLTDAIFGRARRLYSYLGGTLLWLMLGLPLYMFGLLNNYLPYIIPSKLTKRITTDLTYRAPMMLTIGLFTFSLFYGLQIWAVQRYFGQPVLTAVYAILLPVSGFFVLKYWDLMQQLARTWQALRLFRRKPSLMRSLHDERTALFGLIENLKEEYRQQPSK